MKKSRMETNFKLFVGLGNPGKKYENTRHNVGFMIIDELAYKWGMTLKEEKKFKGFFGTTIQNGVKVALLKPTTYMNLSGEAIAEVVHFYQLKNEDVMIIYDDLDMGAGKVRFRTKGSSGGHNGIKSTILHLAGENFGRFKLGIGKPAHATVTDHVLGRFTDEERPIINEAIGKVVKGCELALTKEWSTLSAEIGR